MNQEIRSTQNAFTHLLTAHGTSEPIPKNHKYVSPIFIPCRTGKKAAKVAAYQKASTQIKRITPQEAKKC